MSLRIPRSLPTAAQKIGRAIGAGIITPGGSGGVVPPVGLTLSNASFSEVDEPGSEVGVFGNRLPNTSLTIVPDNGCFRPNGDGSKLVVGLVPADPGTVVCLFIEKPVDGVGESRSTVLTLTINPQGAVSPLGVMQASQTPLMVTGLARLVPTYTGPLIRVIDSGGTQRDVAQNADGSGYDLTQFAVWGDGLNFTVLRVYDQLPGGKFANSSARPKLLFPNLVSAGGDYSGASIEATSATQQFVTTDITINVGGVNNLAVLMGVNSNGYTSGTTPYTKPNSTVWNNTGTLLGYGTTASGVLLRGNSGYVEAETTWYGQRGELTADAVSPDNADKTRSFRGLWMNQRGALLASGGGQKRAFTGRQHGVADAQAQRLVIGAHGAQGGAHNGAWKYLVVYNPAAPMTDLEVQRISLGLEAKFAGFVPIRVPKRAFSIAAGQSLMQYYQGFSTSTGNAADDAKTRVFEPELKAYLGAGSDPRVELYTTFQTTAYGGTRLMRIESTTAPNGPGGTSWLPFAAGDDQTTLQFWYDQINDLPGPLAQLWRQNVLNPLYPGLKYRMMDIAWGQGEANASAWSPPGQAEGSGDTGIASSAAYEVTLPKLWAFFRSVIGRDVPILLQPIGRQKGTNYGTRVLRLIQARLAAKLPGVHLSADTQHMTFDPGDGVHWGKGPADPNGFDRAAKQLARASAALLGAQNVVYRGPNIVSASQPSSNVVRVKVEWGFGAGGSDIQAVDGSTTGLVGFEVSDGSGVRTVTNGARFSATEIDLTVSGAALSGSVLVSYIPQSELLDRSKMVVDNFAGVNMPLRTRVGVPVTG